MPSERAAKRRAANTFTSSFGVSRREGHDSSEYYARGLVQVRETKDKVVAPARQLNEVFAHSAEHMDELPDNSVALMVTSPPYHVGKD